jgi:hypothetical protein
MGRRFLLLVPAQAGIHVCVSESDWIPAFAGTTKTFMRLQWMMPQCAF